MGKIYTWKAFNNMSFNLSKLQLLSLQPNHALKKDTLLFSQEMRKVLEPGGGMNDLGILVDSEDTFNVWRNETILRAKRIAGWVLRTFSTHDYRTVVTLWKSLIQVC